MMKRNAWISCTLALGIFWISTNKANAAGSELPSVPMLNPPKIKAAAAILADAKTGTVLFSQNENEPRPIASTQKLLTALLIVEEGDLDRAFTIQESDTLAEPTKLGFKAGDVYTRRELLTALLVHSTNDAAVALARDNAGSVEAFADKMNRRAFVLGAKHSHFVNPNGLPVDDQYSTAADLLKIAMAAHENPTLREIVKTKYMVFQYSNGHKVPFKNTNRILREQAYCTGMKTGYTDKARHCLVASGEAGDREVIAVVLGCGKIQAGNDAAQLLCYGLGIPYKTSAGETDDDTAPAKPKRTSTTRHHKKKSN